MPIIGNCVHHDISLEIKSPHQRQVDLDLQLVVNAVRYAFYGLVNVQILEVHLIVPGRGRKDSPRVCI